MELSDRLRAALERRRPDLHPPDALVFPSGSGGPMNAENFRRRVFNPIVQKTFPEGRALTPHSLRHTWASLHLNRGTPVKWIQEQGGWASSKMLLDVYGHFMPPEMGGHAEALERLRGASERSELDGAADPDGPEAEARS